LKSNICLSRLDEKTFLINEIKVLLVDETTEDIPLVSVTMITYNHEKYIRQAIEGVLMQKVDFKFVLIIGEDCSNDETRRIVKEYQLLNKDKLILKLPETNLGVNVNSFSNKYFCKGKYVAECEGDDYWTDPLKLQKQVDFLEANEEYLFCGHQIKVLGKKGMEMKKSHIGEFTLKHALTQFVCHTSSFFYRSDAFVGMTFDRNFNGDFQILCYLTQKGKGFVLPDDMSVYRNQGKGTHTSLSEYYQQYDQIKVQIFKIQKYPFFLKEQLKISCSKTTVFLINHFRSFRYSDVNVLILIWAIFVLLRQRVYLAILRNQ
jgi:glycosyltransferase involved in cell wall biosynthesis